MLVHSRLTAYEMSVSARPRVLIGGVGVPWRRDLDLGRILIDEVAGSEWPSGVVVEDFSYSAHRVMHTLQAFQPHKLVLVGATERGRPPGSVRRYDTSELPPLDSEDVAARLGESVGGVIDLDHILVVNRWFDTLPEDTVVIEVESGDQSFGVGYSPQVEAAIAVVVEMIREEAR